MFCQHFASSLSKGDPGRDSRRFADLTVDTAAIFAQTGTLAIDCFQCSNAVALQATVGSLDRLVSGSNQHHFGLWGGRIDRDCPAVGLLLFAGRAVRRGVHTSLHQTPRLASGTTRKRDAHHPKGVCLTDSSITGWHSNPRSPMAFWILPSATALTPRSLARCSSCRPCGRSRASI